MTKKRKRLRRRPVPANLYAVIDRGDGLDAKIDSLLEVHTTRREADQACAKFNRLEGYEPTCLVVPYTRSR